MSRSTLIRLWLRIAIGVATLAAVGRAFYLSAYNVAFARLFRDPVFQARYDRIQVQTFLHRSGVILAVVCALVLVTFVPTKRRTAALEGGKPNPPNAPP
jgi:hypothetical protein